MGDNEITIWIIEEHEPCNDDFPVIVVAGRWTLGDARACAQELSVRTRAERPDVTVELFDADDDQGEAPPDVWYEVTAIALPPIPQAMRETP